MSSGEVRKDEFEFLVPCTPAVLDYDLNGKGVKGVGHGSLARSPFHSWRSQKASVLRIESESIRCPVHLIAH